MSIKNAMHLNKSALYNINKHNLQLKYWNLESHIFKSTHFIIAAEACF
jgi:hypothetical protein